MATASIITTPPGGVQGGSLHLQALVLPPDLPVVSGQIITQPVEAPASGRTAPTFPDAADLVEGTGTRSFAPVSTQPGDWLVVEVIGEDGLSLLDMPATEPGLTFTRENNVGAGGAVRVQHWTAPDAAGGTRTVTITPSGSGFNYHAFLTVVRGSDGPGTGRGVSGTNQTVSVTRQADNSAMVMTVGDWAAGSVFVPVWTPGGSTTASQQGVAGTYIFGRWDDAGPIGTAAHGISSPGYITPSVAVLELLGQAAAGGPTTYPGAASGASISTGSADATLTMAATAAGASTSTGAAAARLLMAAAASGASASSGSATPRLVLAGAAVGASASTGAAAVTVILAASATGTSASTGSAAATIIGPGPVTHQGAATGASTSSGSAAVTLRLAGNAFGSSSSTGAASAGQVMAVAAAGASVSTGSAAAAVFGAVVSRPFSGTTVRPGGGATNRPSGGTTVRPATSSTTRPSTGTIPRP